MKGIDFVIQEKDLLTPLAELTMYIFLIVFVVLLVTISIKIYRNQNEAD